VNIEDLRAWRAGAPAIVLDFVDGGAEDEVTLRGNRAAFDRLRFRPKTLVDVSKRSLATTILGKPAAMPVIAGPVGLLGLTWRHGDLEIARAAVAAGIPHGMSTSSMDSLEDVARVAPGRLWFQCYVFQERSVSEDLVRRAAAAGYEALSSRATFPSRASASGTCGRDSGRRRS
jgi:isopentenyl diphosphate isomerase/L-lactate dehydrogenase-like FMN-dependent dehydrogenase